MEPIKEKVRLVANLGIYTVIKVEQGTLGTRFTIALPNNVTLTADLPYRADVRIGDRLTLYTEVLANALPITTSVQ